ncbi:DNA alkylation repair protein [Paenibacillus mendelii]|uniref:DNA alkylation repair protein n=1 Tax=Paenibacillus mendelii TaxID=206163 RepID=A0ABV6J6Q9_9BACL|nr:DNA alkylation repair protein [Paenibacillus mendelii]MCQ6561972.1 DNA alkylation repair protein [Paenibacillus mendelii]
MNSAYVNQLEEWLRSQANEANAGPMSTYMRNRFPFLGLKNPERVILTRSFLLEYGMPPDEELEQIVRELWLLPEREFQYTAMHLLEKRMKQSEPERIELLQWMITTKSWWDTVDLIAGKLVGGLFTRYPELIPVYTDIWIASEDLWLRRSAILFQLGYKRDTDQQLLFDYIRRCAGEDDFFIRKAIGWALREYSKTDKEAVIAFVAETKLSPLSVREALKWVQAKEGKAMKGLDIETETDST